MTFCKRPCARQISGVEKKPIMKTLSPDQMCEFSGGAGGTDCALSVVGSVALTVGFAASVAATGGATLFMAGAFMASKLIATGSIIANCTD
jgi:hypothetical protein